MKKIIFKGCGTAIVTPFLDDKINFKVFKDLIEFQIANHADSIIVCGTTGESATLSLDEKKELIDFAINTVNKRIPVIVGSGSNYTKNAIELSKFAENSGADGLLIVSPYYNKTTQEGLIEHFSTIASSTLLPIILYNVPSRTGLNIEPTTCLALSKFENIVAIKEASSNISQITNIASLCGDNLKIYSGNDDQTVPILSLGGIGVISVLGNIIPNDIHELVYSYLQGNIEYSRNKQLEIIELSNILFSEVNPIPIKAALTMIGFDVGKPRLPLIEMSNSGKVKLREMLKKFY